MKITMKWLKAKGACEESKEEFANQPCKSFDGALLVKLLIKKENFDCANWLVVRLMNHKQQIRYAIYAAEQVLDIFEKKYPNDDRPRKAIEAAKRYLKNQTKENKDAAAYAADAADAAAYAAYAAYAAANADMKVKIINYGLKLITRR